MFLKLYLFLALLGLHCHMGFALVTVSRGSSLFSANELLMVAASLIAEHRLGHWASVVAAPGF